MRSTLTIMKISRYNEINYACFPNSFHTNSKYLEKIHTCAILSSFNSKTTNGKNQICDRGSDRLARKSYVKFM